MNVKFWDDKGAEKLSFEELVDALIEEAKMHNECNNLEALTGARRAVILRYRKARYGR